MPAHLYGKDPFDYGPVGHDGSDHSPWARIGGVLMPMTRLARMVDDENPPTYIATVILEDGSKVDRELTDGDQVWVEGSSALVDDMGLVMTVGATPWSTSL